jgi:hypothetical protein
MAILLLLGSVWTNRSELGLQERVVAVGEGIALNIQH